MQKRYRGVKYAIVQRAGTEIQRRCRGLEDMQTLQISRKLTLNLS